MTSAPITSVCRACLQTNGEFHDLFTLYKDVHYLPNIIYECTSIQVNTFSITIRLYRDISICENYFLDSRRRGYSTNNMYPMCRSIS